MAGSRAKRQQALGARSVVMVWSLGSSHERIILFELLPGFGHGARQSIRALVRGGAGWLSEPSQQRENDSESTTSGRPSWGLRKL